MPIHPAVIRLGRSKVFLTVAPRVLHRVDLAVHRLTGGRFLPTQLLGPAVVVTTRGRRSGLPRPVPLAAHRYGNGDWLVVGTNYGRSSHPAWSANLLHDPHATVTFRGETQPVTARLIPPERHPAYRPQILAMMPIFDEYAARAERGIRVFLLEPSK